MKRLRVWPAAIAAMGLTQPLSAQQDVPMRGTTPIAPQGLIVPPLPEGPLFYDTAEGQDIRVVIVTRELEFPWSIAFPADGDLLVTEKPGRLRLIRDGVLVPEPVAGVPEVVAGGLSAGLFDLILHPDFATNRLVYFAYTKASSEGGNRLTFARSQWDGTRLVGTEDIYSGRGGSARLAFGQDGMLYATAGGNTLRLTPDGKAPPDNPFVNDDAVADEVFTQGHRSSIGLAVHPRSGAIWQTENGPNGGDEINVLKAGANYGWPMVSLGRDYAGPWAGAFHLDGYEDPIVYWTPAIATSGIAFYTGDALPKWKGDVFVGGLRTGEIPGTGHIERILFNQEMQELRRERLLENLRQRIRDVRMGPDELLYVLTDEEEGAVLRIEPAEVARED